MKRVIVHVYMHNDRKEQCLERSSPEEGMSKNMHDGKAPNIHN